MGNWALFLSLALFALGRLRILRFTTDGYLSIASSRFHIGVLYAFGRTWTALDVLSAVILVWMIWVWILSPLARKTRRS